MMDSSFGTAICPEKTGPKFITEIFMIYFVYFNEGVPIVSAKFNDLVVNSPKTKQKLIENVWIIHDCIMTFDKNRPFSIFYRPH